jgi:hypothetical protein
MLRHWRTNTRATTARIAMVGRPSRFPARLYHKRSNVEATFSMIKRVFGDSVRSKTETARQNEVLLKILCHNPARADSRDCRPRDHPTFPGLGCPESPAAAPNVIEATTV